MQVEIVDADVGIVAHAPLIVRPVDLDESFALTGNEIGLVSGTIYKGRAVQGNAVWYAYVRHVKQWLYKRKVVALGLQVDLCKQVVDVGEVGDSAIGLCVEGGRQCELQAFNLHLVHVTAYFSLDAKWPFGPFALESFRHVSSKEHDVLFADGCINVCAQLAGRNGVHPENINGCSRAYI